MHFLRLTDAEDARFAPAFALYQASFPLHEQRTEAAQRALMGNPAYHFLLILADETPAGILLCWQFDRYAYIEHFAIQPALRGQDLGSQVLRSFCQDQQSVILEIDPPVDEISRRRAGFYQRLGFCANPHPHQHPPYRSGNPPHALVLMSYPQAITEAQYQGFAADLAAQVMADGPADA